MSYAEQWAALATQIKGLVRAGELYGLFQSHRDADSYGAEKFLREQCVTLAQSLEQFRRDFVHALPSTTVARIDRFLGTNLVQAVKNGATDSVRGALVGLSAFEAEITFLLAGRQEHIKARTERALLHLQRVLVVDPDMSAKWKKAFIEGEVACERLGSIHLLSHGIYAFKVDAIGARTDLVYNEPPPDALLAQAVEGIVLTEWKVAKNTERAMVAARSARVQADRYSQGALAGLELTSHRYIIVVTQKGLPQDSLGADERAGGGVIYRYVNIVTEPDVPSKAAKVLTGSTKK
ncbi:hypothetical protein IVB41_06690 [Bradyrhizobium sp. 44]|uniref:hypothetical protein n=1 Tax=Bradyrhizobium sp. 44 TaxID=2782675 RepID=UPI001FFABE07|nr:hypothetical protein [Bradyrhizobium sp. 44]MCK1283624.1 hypothetical protein [Bradyrhizobium sp. 44]